MIYILTGDIRTGKTTALLEWTTGRKDADGLLCPDDEKGKRYFLKVESREKFPLEVEVENERSISIGSFLFLKSAFAEANHYLISRCTEHLGQYLIIDEIGKLELKNEGLHIAAEALIPNYMINDSEHLILVVRKSLVDEVINQYQIGAYTLISKEDLAKKSFA
ncbi:MAG: nucleoside-triphosphatase THEP1 [Cryomorphaceae bacterium]|jgi:nucleoside-triphosphatase THEP1